MGLASYAVGGIVTRNKKHLEGGQAEDEDYISLYHYYYKTDIYSLIIAGVPTLDYPHWWIHFLRHHRLSGLKNQKFTFSLFWKLQIQDQGVGRVGFL